MNDLGLGQIEEDINFNFKHKYDEEKEIFTDNLHSCKHFEMPDIKNKFMQHKNSFSSYSHNIRSINGHWDDILDLINSAKPFKFSVLAFQEVWSVNKNYKIPGYGKFEFITRDKSGSANPNCGGGVGLFIDNKYTDYEILEDFSIFIPNVYESIWVKIKMTNGRDKIMFTNQTRHHWLIYTRQLKFITIFWTKYKLIEITQSVMYKLFLILMLTY